jgi:hypothetical protein
MGRGPLGGGSGDRLGEREQFGVLLAAEVLRPEQFLQADDLRALSGGFADLPLGFLEILVRVSGATHLHETDPELFFRERAHKPIMRGMICNMRTLVLVFVSVFGLGAQTSDSGWISLFDGKSLSGWMWSMEADPPAPAWTAEDGMLRTAPGQGKPTYLLTRESFTDFEMVFDWKMEAGGNSGVKYRFQGYWVKGQVRAEPEAGPERVEPIALEYQIIDDERHPDALSDAKHTTAAIYEYWPASKKAPVRADVWHSSRIVARGLHIEHWLDGREGAGCEVGCAGSAGVVRGKPAARVVTAAGQARAAHVADRAAVSRWSGVVPGVEDPAVVVSAR